MKLLFSEAKPDYKNYVFPYAVWAVPEAGESPELFFDRGFLPSSRELDRFYLCRSVRVVLPGIKPTSENRRILRKCGSISCRLVPCREFDFDDSWQDFCLTYADIKFGKNVMTVPRLQTLVKSKLTTHFLVFHDDQSHREVGVVTLFLQPPYLAQYYYAFYDLAYYRRNLGMYMMTTAVFALAEAGLNNLYLGSCYSRNALYKTQFAGAQFFNGVNWCNRLAELKFLITRDETLPKEHLLESDYVHRFYDGKLGELIDRSVFALRG